MAHQSSIIRLLHGVQRVAFVALAGVVFYAAGILANYRIQVMSLNQIVGDVLTSQVRYVDQGRFSGYRPLVEYRYTVGGVEYRNDVFHLAGWNDVGNRKWAETTAQKFEAGSQCTVYYDAHAPQASCLTNQIRSGIKDGVAICFFVVFGSWCALIGLRGPKPGSASVG